MKDAGIYPRAQLLAMGYDDHSIRKAVRAGSLIRLRIGWFATPNADETAMAAVRDGGVLTCVDALAFHELWIPPGHKDRLHMRRSRSMRGKNRACRPLQGYLTTADRAVDSIAVALSCAARCLSAEEWIAVCDSYMNATGKSLGDLAQELDGAGPTVTDRLGRTERLSQSGTESIARLRLRAVGYNVVVQPQVDGVGRVDLRIGVLLIECDSMLYHASKEDYERDHHRDRRAMVAGWLKLRLTYDDIIYDWEGVLADIREITRAERHRARSVRKRALVERSVRQSLTGGSVPSNEDWGC
ncbi:endonuclease domain-containing protein [Gordonia hydrophobica]|uniref:DUF559 domain-containing protein n=1 Tax=Gordonia hydrophobica TaxID=40516 RepID=A0ABZ2U305_9ACTN|nr:hypothetical protein [Gordonia hydrophobica]MBM7368997.1 very-short-patch-repair endonuclease [Gordonia hydrophobica]